jgi:hypothetical protein
MSLLGEFEKIPVSEPEKDLAGESKKKDLVRDFEKWATVSTF